MSYPNLMCFGYDLVNCDCKERCPDYEDCYDAYCERYFSFVESENDKD